MVSTRGRAVAVLVVLGLVVLAGAGGTLLFLRDDGPLPAAQGLAGAAPSPSPSETPTGTSRPSLDGEARAFLRRARAGFGRQGSVHVRLRLDGPLSSSAEGDTSYGPRGSRMRMSMAMSAMGGGRIELLVLPGSAFMAMPRITPPGKYFVVPEDSRTLAGLSGGAGGMSPRDAFAGIRAGLESVERLGREQIGGEPVEHYRLVVDSARSMAATGVGQVPGLPAELHYDVWLDREDRMRRIRYAFGGTDLVMDMTRWGKPVDISAPPRSDLVEAPPGI